MRKEGKLPSQSPPVVFEFVSGQFRPVEWSAFVRLPLREIVRRAFVLKSLGLYFVGDGWDTDIGKIVARKHPGKVRHLMEWLEIVLPYWASDLMDKPLLSIPLRSISDADASEVLARIQKLATQQAEMMA